MLGRARDRFDLYPQRLLGDSGYGSAAMLGWLVYDQGIEPHVTVFDKSKRKDGTFSREPISPTTTPRTSIVVRAALKQLRTTGRRVNDDATRMLYLAPKKRLRRLSR